MKKTEITEQWHATKELQIYTENTQSLQTAARILETLGLSKRITQHSTDKPLLKNLQRLPMAHSAEFNLPFPTSKLRFSTGKHHLYFFCFPPFTYMLLLGLGPPPSDLLCPTPSHTSQPTSSHFCSHEISAAQNVGSVYKL